MRALSFCIVISFLMTAAPMVLFAPSENDVGAQEISSGSEVQNLIETAGNDNGFIENKGQIGSDEILFYSSEGNIFFTPSGVMYRFREMEPIDEDGTDDDQSMGQRNEAPKAFHEWGVVLRYSFIGSNDVVPTGRMKCSWYTNYFKGNDSEKWYTEVPSYMEVVYPELWDGIDLIYRLNEGAIKYDLIVHPGADISDIRIRIDGAEGLSKNLIGDLVIETDYWNIRDSGLYSYYLDGPGEPLPCRFQLINEFEYTFNLESYDMRRILVIDPTLAYSTFIGGPNYDYGEAIAIDTSRNAYITGSVHDDTIDYPTTIGAYDTTNNGNYDVFVTKLSSTGSSLIFSTFIGGHNSDYGYGITIDLEGNAYIAGVAGGSDYPTTPGAYDTTFIDGGFVTKLSSTGSSLIYSTFIDYTNIIQGITIDPIGNAYITGFTSSYDFPTTPGAYDTSNNGGQEVFVTKVNSSGSSLVFSTYLGGSGVEESYGIAIDSSNNTYIAGWTASSDYPTTSGAYDTSHNGLKDAFITKLNSSGSSLIYSTYIGGSTDDEVFAMAMDSGGNIYITGETLSTDYPTTAGAYDTSNGGSDDVFVTKLNSAGSSLSYSTFIGGVDGETGYAIDVDSSGQAYISGITRSSSYPTTSGAYDTSFNGNYDVFLSKIDSDGATLSYSTFIGGLDSEVGYGIAVDPYGNAFITGRTASTDYPTTLKAYDITHNGNYDVFVTNIKFTTVPTKPLNLNGTIGNGFIQLKWEPPIDNGGPEISNYTIYKGQTSTALSKLMTLGNVTEYNDTAIINGQTYYYYITANNSIDVSLPSDIIKVFDTISPVFIENLTPSIATTGDDFELAVICRDNVLVDKVMGIIDDHFENITNFMMSNKGNDKWVGSISIPSGKLYSFSYVINAYDLSGNGAGIGGTVQVIDNDKPFLLADRSIYPPTTGETLNLSFDLDDNIGVRRGSLLVSNYSLTPNMNFSDETFLLLHGEGKNWFTPLDIDHFLRNLSFTLGIEDTSGNIAIINLTDRRIIDNDPPIFIGDLTQKVGFTGEYFNFSLMAIDWIGIQNATVEYWYVDGVKHVMTMRHDEWWDMWNATILIDESPPFIFTNRTIIELNYSFQIWDTSGNELVYNATAKQINDTFDPILVSDLSDKVATTGDPFKFEVEVSDNMGIERVEVHFRYLDLGRSNGISDIDDLFNVVQMKGDEQDIYEHSIIVPSDYWRAMQYRFQITDIMGNVMSTELMNFIIHDNDPPEIIDIFNESEMTTGEDLTVWVQATDNAYVNEVKVEYWFSSNIEQKVLLNDNGTHKTLIHAPFSSVEPLHLKIHLIDVNANENVTNEIVVQVIDNDLPTIMAISDISLNKGDILDVTVQASDNIGITEYRWEGAPLLSSGATLRGNMNEAGTYFVKVTVLDAAGNQNSTQFKVVVEEPAEEEGFPLWLLLLIIAVIVLVIIGIVLGFVLGRRKEVWVEKEPKDGPEVEMGPEPPSLEKPPEQAVLPPPPRSSVEMKKGPEPTPPPQAPVQAKYVAPDQVPMAPLPVKDSTYIAPEKKKMETENKQGAVPKAPVQGKEVKPALIVPEPEKLLNPMKEEK